MPRLILMVERDQSGHLLLRPHPLAGQRLARDLLHGADESQLPQLVPNLHRTEQGTSTIPNRFTMSRILTRQDRNKIGICIRDPQLTATPPTPQTGNEVMPLK
jgi:hypothetical protein